MMRQAFSDILFKVILIYLSFKKCLNFSKQSSVCNVSLATESLETSRPLKVFTELLLPSFPLLLSMSDIPSPFVEVKSIITDSFDSSSDESFAMFSSLA